MAVYIENSHLFRWVQTHLRKSVLKSKRKSQRTTSLRVKRSQIWSHKLNQSSCMKRHRKTSLTLNWVICAAIFKRYLSFPVFLHCFGFRSGIVHVLNNPSPHKFFSVWFALRRLDGKCWRSNVHGRQRIQSLCPAKANAMILFHVCHTFVKGTQMFLKCQ